MHANAHSLAPIQYEFEQYWKTVCKPDHMPSIDLLKSHIKLQIIQDRVFI